MSDLLQRFSSGDDGACLVEYELLVIGLTAALFQPSLFSAAYYRLADLTDLLTSQLVRYF
jgi:hypothetical protein